MIPSTSDNPDHVRHGTSNNCNPSDQGVTVKCRVRRSKRSIDPEFGPCLESIISFSSAPKPALIVRGCTFTLVRHRSFGHPPLLPDRPHSNGRAARSLNEGTFSVMGAIEGNGAAINGELELDEGGEEGDWVGGAAAIMSGDDAVRDASAEERRDSKKGNSVRDEDKRPPKSLVDFNRHTSPLVRTRSNITQSHSESIACQSGRPRCRSRSRSQSRVRKGSSGAVALAAFADAELEGSAHSLTPLRHRNGTLDEESTFEQFTVSLKDVVSVDNEVPSRTRSSSTGSDFYSSVASDTGPSSVISAPPPLNHLHGKTAQYRIFLHTSSRGYIEFSFDSPNSHDILMAFLSAHLKSKKIPNKSSDNKGIPSIEGALQTMILTPSKSLCLTNNSPYNYGPPKLTESASTESACTLDKLQKKIIQQRIQQENTPLEKIKENFSSWMSSLVDCACCFDSTVAPEPEQKKEPEDDCSKKTVDSRSSPNTVSLRKKGICGLSFEESSTA